MTKNSITSGQVNQIIGLIGPAVRAALKQLDPSKDETQKLIVQRGGDLKAALIPQLVGLFRSLVAVFDPASFIGDGWYIDPSDVQLPAAPNNIDPKDIVFKSMHRSGETILNGEERLRRHHEAGNLCLTADHFLRFWDTVNGNMRDRLPEEWKQTDEGETRFIYFDATVLRDPDGNRYALCLYWDDGAWNWYCVWLDVDFYRRNQSGVAGK
jgi:hypothetical protein